MKKILWTFTSLIILCALLVLFLPMIASTSIGKKILENVISERTKGDLDVSSWELSWFGPQVIRNAHFQGDQVELSFTEAQTNLPFWSFLTITQFDEKLFKKLDGSAELKNGQIVLYDKKKPIIHLQNIDLNLNGNEGEDIHFNLKGDSQVDQLIGSILIDGKITDPSNLFSSAFPTTIKVITVNFPTKSIDAFFQTFKKSLKNEFFQTFKKNTNFFFSLLGPKVNANLLIDGKNSEGSFALEVLSSNLKTTLDGKIENDKFYLNQDLNITYQLSNSFAKKLIDDSNPLLVTSVESLNPITVSVFKEGFQLPLNLNTKDIVIPKAILNVGKLKCKNEKTLAIITELIKLQKLEKLNEIFVWCTPFTFQVKDNILSAKRADALIADSVHICTYGDINISNNNMDMILGIPQDTLESVFKIKNLPKEFVLQIPLKGTLKKPKVNLKKITAKIAALTAAQAANKKIPDLEVLLNILGKFDEKKVPPPNPPFPWEQGKT